MSEEVERSMDEHTRELTNQRLTRLLRLVRNVRRTDDDFPEIAFFIPITDLLVGADFVMRLTHGYRRSLWRDSSSLCSSE